MHKINKLTHLEKRSIVALASVYGLRMFGLFLILPVLAIYAEELDGASPMLMGIALGIYGISQALLQLPFGVLSDRVGRKPVIVIGLSIFVIGSLVAAFSTSIAGVIVGRALQGAGAIAAVILALTSDLTREEQRTKAMAFIGISIGLSFFVALVAAPLLEFFIGVKGLFIMTAVLGFASIFVIWKLVPTPVQTQTINLEVRAVPKRMFELLRDPLLLRLDVGIFILHFVLMAMFVVVPIMLSDQLALETRDHWRVYIPALLGSVVFMVPMIILSGRKHLLRRVFVAAVAILLFAQCLLIFRPNGVIGMTACLFFFFWGFNLLEAILPSLVSRLAPAAGKGSAMGVYNTFQFLGVFFGGLIGGIVYGQVGIAGVFVVSALLLLVWIWLIKTAPPLKLLDSLVLKVPPGFDADRQTQLEAVEGVEEVIVIEGESTAYLKVDNKKLDMKALNELVMVPNPST